MSDWMDKTIHEMANADKGVILNADIDQSVHIGIRNGRLYIRAKQAGDTVTVDMGDSLDNAYLAYCAVANWEGTDAAERDAAGEGK